MNIAIIGTGLIGGSIALRIHGFQTNIIGVDKSEENLTKALELGIINEKMPLSNAVKIADLIILAIPVDAARELLPGILDAIAPNATVVDMGSTKQGICDKVRKHPKRSRYVASHPIAGTENSGPEAAFPNLYDGKTTIICEKELSDADAIDTVEKLYKIMGMNIIYMNASEHDKHIAYVSHLTHVIAYALSLTVLEIEKNEKTIFDMAGSGFGSTVRIAKSSTEMWTPILQQNSKYLVESIGQYIDILNDFKTAIENGNHDTLYKLIKDANVIRKILDKDTLVINKK